MTEGRDGKTPDMLKGMKNYRQPGLRGDTALPRVLRGASGSYVTLESIQIILCFSAYFFPNFPLKKELSVYWAENPELLHFHLHPHFGEFLLAPRRCSGLALQLFLLARSSLPI